MGYGSAVGLPNYVRSSFAVHNIPLTQFRDIVYIYGGFLKWRYLQIIKKQHVSIF